MNEVFQQAAQALETVTEGRPVELTTKLEAEHAVLLRFCPHLCNGSTKGVGSYLADIAERSGRDMEHVSYSWRTHHTLLDFLADLQ